MMVCPPSGSQCLHFGPQCLPYLVDCASSGTEEREGRGMSFTMATPRTLLLFYGIILLVPADCRCGFYVESDAIFSSVSFLM